MYNIDCRTDNDYNEKFLNEDDKKFLNGFDWAMEMAVDNFFDNDMCDLQDENSYLGHILNEELPDSIKEAYKMDYKFGSLKSEDRVTNTYADRIRMRLLEWIESERNRLIISMIDNMDEFEYEMNKRGNPV